MKNKPRKQKDEDSSYARVTRNFLLKELECTNVSHEFNEEAQNGSIMAIAGDDYAIIATDARHTDDAKQALHKITNKLVLATTGCQCKAANLASLLRARMFMNEYMRQRVMPAQCIAMMLSCLLTNHTCCHNHISIILAGLDHNGKGVVYAYNPLGYHEKTKFRAMGVANTILQPILNKRLSSKLKRLSRTSQTSMAARASNQAIKILVEPKLSFNEAFELTECAFKKSAQCSDIYTGNVLVLQGITKDDCFNHEIMLKNQLENIEACLKKS